MRRRLSLAAVALSAAGLSLTGIAGAVVGGKAISVDLAPWTVFVRSTFARGEHLECTGAIVSTTRVLTAAHCLFSKTGAFARPAQIEVEAGISNSLRREATDRQQTRRVVSIRVDPKYLERVPATNLDLAHDLAVLNLSKPLDLGSPLVQAADLFAPGTAIRAGTKVLLAGFGNTSPKDETHGPLSRMIAHVLAHACRPRGIVCDSAPCPTKGVICTSSPRSAVCWGDSGAALVTATGSPRIVGILSRTAETQPCTPGGIDVYASLLTASARRFVFGDSGGGPPRRPRATRWVPSGWTSLDVQVGNTILPLRYSLPQGWLWNPNLGQRVHGWNPATQATVLVGIAHGSTRERYVAKARRAILLHYRKIDSDAAMSSRVVRLQGTLLVEISTQLVKTVNGQRTPYTIRDYLFFHETFGYDLNLYAPSRFDRANLRIFARIIRTIHFTY